MRECQGCGLDIDDCDICGTTSNDETCDWCNLCAQTFLTHTFSTAPDGSLYREKPDNSDPEFPF